MAIVQQLDTNYLRQLNYREINLRELEVEVVEEADEESCGVAIKHGKEMFNLTESSLKQLADGLKIPYKFTKTLRDSGRSHVISYLQKQLSQVTSKDAVMVFNKVNEEDALPTIQSISEPESLHYRGQEAEKLDQRITEVVNAPNSPFELYHRTVSNGEIEYGLLYKDPSKIDEDKGDGRDDTKDLVGLWKAGFLLRHSVLGLADPVISVQLLRLVCSNLSYLPEKQVSYALDYEAEFEDRWAHVNEFLLDPPKAPWSALEDYVTKLSRTPASFLEVKEARRKLMKLKVDSEDTETQHRINTTLQWPRITKAYGLKDLEFKPSKSWMSRASTPLSLFDVFNFITREATHVADVDHAVRQNILIYGGQILTKRPDLADRPPVINWENNV